MNFDEEILQRLTNTEDHFTERKTSPHRDQITETIVAFANTALPNKPGIIYVGVTDEGQVVGGDNLESWQQKITGWANGCFPEVVVITRVFQQDNKSFLAVVVPLSEARPHFARPAFKRQGPKTVPASQEEIDKWIAYRLSKVKELSHWIGKAVTVQGDVHLPHLFGVPVPDRPRHPRWGLTQATLRDVNQFWATFEEDKSEKSKSEPLSKLTLSWDDQRNQLLILVDL